MSREEKAAAMIRSVIVTAREKKLHEEHFEFMPGWNSWTVMSMPDIMVDPTDEDSDYFVRCVADECDCSEEEAKGIIARNELNYVIRTNWEFDGAVDTHYHSAIDKECLSLDEADEAIVAEILEDFCEFSALAEEKMDPNATDEEWELFKIYVEDWHKQTHDPEDQPTWLERFLETEMTDPERGVYYRRLLQEKDSVTR